jgi:hypothetical protein
MHPDEVVVGREQRERVDVVSIFFEKALVNRVNLRMCIRSVRFWRSANDVLIYFGSGDPSIRRFSAPMHSVGL